MSPFSFFRSLIALRLALEFAKFFVVHFSGGDAWDSSPNDPRMGVEAPPAPVAIVLVVYPFEK